MCLLHATWYHQQPKTASENRTFFPTHFSQAAHPFHFIHQVPPGNIHLALESQLIGDGVLPLVQVIVDEIDANLVPDTSLALGGASAGVLVYSYSSSESSCPFDRSFPTECHVFHIADLDNLKAGEPFIWHMPFTYWDNIPIVATAGPDEMIYVRSRSHDP